MKNLQLNIKFRSSYKLDKKPDSFLSLFDNKLSNNSDGLIGRVVTNHVFVKIDSKNRHIWSPEMELTLEKDASGTKVREIIGPNSSIYTFTMFLFFFAGTLLIFTLMYLLSQISLDMDTSITWILIAVSSLFLVGNFLFLLLGRKKGIKQMRLLKQFSDSVFNNN